MWSTAEEKLLDEITLRCTCRGCGCQACGGLYWVTLREGLRWQMVTETEAREMLGKEQGSARP